MTKEERMQRAEVAKAWAEGKAVQWSDPFRDSHWIDYTGEHPSFYDLSWRIKPEPPNPREWWIEFGPYDNAIQVHRHHSWAFGSGHTIVHVREVLGVEPVPNPPLSHHTPPTST